jgi:hypothetical protein
MIASLSSQARRRMGNDRSRLPGRLLNRLPRSRRRASRRNNRDLHIGRCTCGAKLVLAPMGLLIAKRKRAANDILRSGRILQVMAHRGQFDLPAVRHVETALEIQRPSLFVLVGMEEARVAIKREWSPDMKAPVIDARSTRCTPPRAMPAKPSSTFMLMQSDAGHNVPVFGECRAEIAIVEMHIRGERNVELRRMLME